MIAMAKISPQTMSRPAAATMARGPPKIEKPSTPSSRISR